MNLLPRTLPFTKPGFGSPYATISLPDCSVGAAAWRADAAGTATSAATASKGMNHFTRSPPVSFDLGKSSLARSGAGLQRRTGEALEVADQLFAAAHEIPVLEAARGDSAVDALDEALVLGSDLVVEGHQLVDPRLAD